MAKMRRRRNKRQAMPRSIAIILHSGCDFFGDLQDGVGGSMDLLRRAWADPEIKAAVYERFRAKQTRIAPWAEDKFGK